MFSKVALSTLAVGAISANALAVPVARSPQPESWSEWGTNIGNYYANKYGSPSDVPGLPQFKRSPEPESWSEWGTNIGNYYANKYSSPSSVPGLPQFKREPEPQESWEQWGEAIGNYYAAPWENSKRDQGMNSITQTVAETIKNAIDATKLKREPSPEPESWEEWGTNIGNYYADKYSDPSSVPGLPQFKREPETWGQWGEAIGNYYAAPWENSKRDQGMNSIAQAVAETIKNVVDATKLKREPSPEPESWEEWGTNIGNYYADKYSDPSSVPGLPQFKREPGGVVSVIKAIDNEFEGGKANGYGKREPSPEPETWEEWGTNIGNYYADKYSDPSSVPGLPQF